MFPTSFPGADAIEGRAQLAEAAGEGQPPPVETPVPDGYDQVSSSGTASPTSEPDTAKHAPDSPLLLRCAPECAARF